MENMTFFNEAKADGTIDSKIEMNQQEFEMMLRGMLEDSNAWSMHKNMHQDAHISPIFKEDLSGFEAAVKKHSRPEEPSIIQYDMHSKKFVAGCGCGARFEIDVKNDKVQQSDPTTRAKDLPIYNRAINDDQQASYGKRPAQSQYDNGRQDNPSPSGMKYKI